MIWPLLCICPYYIADAGRNAPALKLAPIFGQKGKSIYDGVLRELEKLKATQKLIWYKKHNKRIKSLAGSQGHQNYAAISLVLHSSLTNRRLSFAAPYAGVIRISDYGESFEP